MANSIPKIEYNNGVSDVTIEFEYPPSTLNFEGKRTRAIAKITESGNGNYATSNNYKERRIDLEFKQVKQSIIDLLDVFFNDFAIDGKSFKYFYHKDEAEFETVQIRKGQREFRPRRTGTDVSTGEKTYRFKIAMRRKY